MTGLSEATTLELVREMMSRPDFVSIHDPGSGKPFVPPAVSIRLDCMQSPDMQGLWSEVLDAERAARDTEWDIAMAQYQANESARRQETAAAESRFAANVKKWAKAAGL